MICHILFLSCSVGLSEHAEAIGKLQQASKWSSKKVRLQMKEIAQLLVFQHLHSDPVDPLACIHRDDGDMEFMNILANQLTPHVSNYAGSCFVCGVCV